MTTSGFSSRLRSFRGRLLLLLIFFACLQALAAATTFRTLQTKPVEEKIQTELRSGSRALGPLIESRTAEASQRLQVLQTNEALITAVQTADAEAISAQLEVAAAATGAAEEANGLTAYITGPDGEMLVGDLPTAPSLQDIPSLSAPLRLGDDLLGVIHVPVVVDEVFFKSADQYFGDLREDYEGLVVFAADDQQIVTSNDVLETRPSGLKEQFNTISIAGTKYVAYSTDVGASTDLLIGTAIPESVIAGLKQEGKTQFYMFVGVLLLFSLIVSYLIVRNVGAVLRQFVKGTKRVADGALDERLPVAGTDEIAQMSQSFNNMAENLQDRMIHLVEARQRLRRQLEAFGEALANSNSVDDMLTAVLNVAIESTRADRARFWIIQDGECTLNACVGLRNTDTYPSEFERAAIMRNTRVMSSTVPQWLAVPVRLRDDIVGILTLVGSAQPFADDDFSLADRLATQAAFALDNAQMTMKLKTQAERDGLTGLINHRKMQDCLDDYMEDARKHGSPMGLAMLDVDNFKSINDTYGHQVGDDALKAIAGVMRSCAPGAGVAARYGGEEFMVVMPGCDIDASFRIADHIRAEIEALEIPMPKGILRLTSSFGCTNLDTLGMDVEKAVMLNVVDKALYVSKRTGKNKVTIGKLDLLEKDIGEAA